MRVWFLLCILDLHFQGSHSLSYPHHASTIDSFSIYIFTHLSKHTRPFDLAFIIGAVVLRQSSVMDGKWATRFTGP